MERHVDTKILKDCPCMNWHVSLVDAPSSEQEPALPTRVGVLPAICTVALLLPRRPPETALSASHVTAGTWHHTDQSPTTRPLRAHC